MPTGDGSRNRARNRASEPPKTVSHHRANSLMSGWRIRVSQSVGAAAVLAGRNGGGVTVVAGGATLRRPAGGPLRRPSGRAGGRTRPPDRPGLVAALSPRLMA